MNKKREKESTNNPLDLYFAFPDGVLDYSCLECNGLCCKDYGLSDNIRKKSPRILELYPAFASAAAGIEGTILSFATPEKCYFLDEDNLCRIEKDYGKEYKMDLCNFFPFNILYKIGKTIAVAPNYLCPMQLRLPSIPGKVKGTHDKLSEIVFKTELLESKTLVTKFHETENADEFIRNEKEFLDVCQENIGKQLFIETLNYFINQNDMLDVFLKNAKSILNIESEAEIDHSEYIDNLLHALSPSIRLTMSILSVESRIKALVLFEFILRRLVIHRNTNETLKSVHRLFQSLGPAIRLLAKDTEVLKIPENKDGELNLPPRLTYGPLVLASHAVTLYAKKGMSTIESLDIALDDEVLTAELRSAFLVEFGVWIENLSI